jgi:putative nucleic acid binding protein
MKKYFVKFVGNHLFYMKKNRVLLIVIFVLVAGYLIYSYIYKNHRDIASEKGVFLVTANAIHDEFKADEKKANAKYLDKTIDVYGKISSIDSAENAIIIDGKMFVVFKDKLPIDLQELSNVKIKGRFIGYDDLLEEMKMDQCVIQTE